ncbi:protein SRC2-like [Aegilops tauschii subsp. strangulata]|uniref:protein SRC2-like n=1 Tax=Aegilops tauschii subsp. strangulata TaxID=200361 RepID=UPI001ABC3290|nr:protein SRC2-like [Aegilops tauschii subsp. strangulata]
MAHRVLELTLVSGHNLKDVNVFSRMEVYAITSVFGDPRTRRCSQVDRDGARHPTWDETFLFTVPPTAAKAAAAGAYLHVLLRTERLFGFDDRDVGEVFIPLADLLACACVGGPPRCASYPVRKVHCTEHRGMLTVAYRFGPVMAPLAQDKECWDDATVVGYELSPWQYYPPTYVYAPEAAVPRYPQACARMPPAPKPAAGCGAAAASPAEKNYCVRNGSFAMGLGAGLLGGGFGGMVFGDMPPSDQAAHDSGYKPTADGAGVAF